MIKFFMDLLSSGIDTPSIMRFAFLLQVLMSNIVVWYIWVFACVWTRSLVNIPPGVVECYLAANGTAFLGKGVQSFAERPRYNIPKAVEPTAKSDVEVL